MGRAKTCVDDVTSDDVVFYGTGGKWNKHRSKHTFYIALIDKHRQAFLARGNYGKRYGRKKFIEDRILVDIPIAYECGIDGKLRVLEKDEIVSKISEHLRRKKPKRKKGVIRKVSAIVSDEEEGKIDVDDEDGDDSSDAIDLFLREDVVDTPSQDIVPSPPILANFVSLDEASLVSAKDVDDGDSIVFLERERARVVESIKVFKGFLPPTILALAQRNYEGKPKALAKSLLKRDLHELVECLKMYADQHKESLMKTGEQRHGEDMVDPSLLEHSCAPWFCDEVSFPDEGLDAPMTWALDEVSFLDGEQLDREDMAAPFCFFEKYDTITPPTGSFEGDEAMSSLDGVSTVAFI